MLFTYLYLTQDNKVPKVLCKTWAVPQGMVWPTLHTDMLSYKSVFNNCRPKSLLHVLLEGSTGFDFRPNCNGVRMDKLMVEACQTLKTTAIESLYLNYGLHRLELGLELFLYQRLRLPRTVEL